MTDTTMTAPYFVSHLHFGVWESGIRTVRAARKSLREAEQVIAPGYSIYRDMGTAPSIRVDDSR